MSLRNKWRRYLALPPADRQAVLIAAFWLPIAAHMLRLAGLRRTQGLLSRFLHSPTAHPPMREGLAMDRALRIAHLVRAAVRNGFGSPNCLAESVVLWFMLCRRGMAGNLRIGVSKEEGRFEAHAWVEFEGVALNENGLAPGQFAAFDASTMASRTASR
jgi:transglutaminase superfamily protein